MIEHSVRRCDNDITIAYFNEILGIYHQKNSTITYVKYLLYKILPFTKIIV